MAAGVPVPFSKVGYTTREEVLTSDLNRMGKLSSRELQDLLADENRTDESISGSDPQSGRGSRVSAASLLPLLSSAAAFTMDLSFGQAFLQDNTIATDVTAGGDDSQYQVVRWTAQNIGFTTPDAGNPRIDLVVVTPTVVDADGASRFTMVNPITRSLQALNVNKTNNPGTNVQIVAGTPDPQPTAPAVPAGALALFEVYIPASAADSTTFKVARRTHRRGAVSVGATMHGILRGCVPAWSVVDESAAASTLTVGNSTTAGPSRVVIDGEVITFTRLSSASPASLVGVVADAGANSPYAASAPATSDKPYYLYLCGGRSLPQGRRTDLSGNALQPLVVVESLVAPDRNGRPSVAITTPRGTTQLGAVYIGVGYVTMNSTRRKPCVVEGDWISAYTGQMVAGPTTFVGFNDMVNRQPDLSATVRTAHNINTRPLPATQARLSALMITNGTTAVQVTLGSVDLGATAVFTEGFLYAGATASTPVVKIDFVANPIGFPAIMLAAPAAVSDISGFLLWARGWNMRVPRIGY